jgi:hypothetical protein
VAVGITPSLEPSHAQAVSQDITVMMMPLILTPWLPRRFVQLAWCVLLVEILHLIFFMMLVRSDSIVLLAMKTLSLSHVPSEPTSLTLVVRLCSTVSRAQLVRTAKKRRYLHPLVSATRVIFVPLAVHRQRNMHVLLPFIFQLIQQSPKLRALFARLDFSAHRPDFRSLSIALKAIIVSRAQQNHSLARWERMETQLL